MKRSEMIKEMNSALKHYLDTDECFKTVSELLLTHLEYKGMLPPISDSTVEERSPYGSTFYEIPEWEPESD